MTPAQTNSIGMFTQVAGAITGAYGIYAANQTDKINARFREDIAGINAGIAELSAQSAIRSGRKEAASIRLRGAQLEGRQRAAFAANGVALDSDSSSEAFASAEYLEDEDVATVEGNAMRTAWGYRNDAASQQINALVAGSGQQGAGFAVAGSLIGSATQLADRWYQFNQEAGNNGRRRASNSGVATPRPPN